MAIYIAQVLLFQLIFLLAYEFLLKKETFFNYNRFYLLFTPILAMILPFLKIQIFSNSAITEAFMVLPAVYLDGPSQTGTIAQKTISETGFQFTWWLVIYSIGLLVNAFLFFKKFYQLQSLYKNKVVSEEKAWKIIEIPASTVAFSFRNTIFIGTQLSEDEKKQILDHELVHVKQKHSLDLLFFEIQKIVFWFNPLVYIYQRRISALHEFIADSQVVKQTEKKLYYQQLLNNIFSTQKISFINQFFNHSLIKKRIVMLQKQKSRSISKLKYLLILPLIFAQLILVACTNEQEDLRNTSEQAIPPPPPPPMVADAILFVEDLKNLSNSELERRKQLIDSLRKTNGSFIITDGVSTVKIETEDQKATTGNEKVPFTVVDQAPVFPGCKDVANPAAMKTCFTEKITAFVAENFKPENAQAYKGEKVYVGFTIDAEGEITGIRARSTHPALEAEAERVIESLPQMEPARKDGQRVGALFTLPIQL